MGKTEKSGHSFDSCLLRTTENRVEQTLGIGFVWLFACLFVMEVQMCAVISAWSSYSFVFLSNKGVAIPLEANVIEVARMVQDENQKIDASTNKDSKQQHSLSIFLFLNVHRRGARKTQSKTISSRAVSKERKAIATNVNCATSLSFLKGQCGLSYPSVSVSKLAPFWMESYCICVFKKNLG